MSTPSTDTLYSQSPHSPIDKREARRKLKAQHRAGQYLDPTYVTCLVLLLALLYWVLPIPGIFELLYRRRHSTCSCDHAAAVTQKPTMPWQKQFTLSSRSKGCHLVTNEIMPHIEEGLKGVKVGMLTLFIQHTSAALSLNENFDRDVRTDMDMVRSTTPPPLSPSPLSPLFPPPSSDGQSLLTLLRFASDTGIGQRRSGITSLEAHR